MPLASISSELSHHIQRFAFDYLDAPVHRITCEDVPSILIFISSALIPIIVSMHEANAVATRSVGEKASPFPLLSVGASVIIVFPERRCVASVLREPL